MAAPIEESATRMPQVYAGPVVNVHMPKDRITGQHQGYGFVEFQTEDDADYAMKIMNMIKLYGKPMRVNKASAHQKQMDIGANIFIGNLDPEVDEKLLFDTFSAFGVILQTPKIMRDPETGNSRGFAFINYASFDASDAAIEAMNGQYLSATPSRRTAKGERHGSAAERLLAAQNPLSQSDRPHQNFAEARRDAASAASSSIHVNVHADAANNAWHDVRAPAAASVDAVSAASSAAASAPGMRLPPPPPPPQGMRLPPPPPPPPSPHFGGGGEGMRGGPPPRPPMGMWPPPPPPLAIGWNGRPSAASAPANGRHEVPAGRRWRPVSAPAAAASAHATRRRRQCQIKNRILYIIAHLG
uniref:RRM domain-containing protein n=1 Tax=Macrostomum lignano TaxID=282301 RepID=A0A1I8F255_9PLAT